MRFRLLPPSLTLLLSRLIVEVGAGTGWSLELLVTWTRGAIVSRYRGFTHSELALK